MAEFNWGIISTGKIATAFAKVCVDVSFILDQVFNYRD